MKTISKWAFALLLTALAAPLATAQESVTYYLPRTVLKLQVKGQQENFYAGPYAAFAKKYLGISVREHDESNFRISDIKLDSYAEADQDTAFVYRFPPKAPAECPALLKLTSQGLVCAKEEKLPQQVAVHFDGNPREEDFGLLGITSPYTSASATLYNQDGETSIHQDMVVGKTLEQKAREAAQMILDMRKTRIQILTGDTDASYTGEAMQAAFEQIDRLEKEYMTLFTGSSTVFEQDMTFEIVPDPAAVKQLYIAFRVSEGTGLCGADAMSGKPYLLELDAPSAGREVPLSNGKKNVQNLIYRVPANCNVKLTDGVRDIFQTRVPVYQLGPYETWPIQNK